MDIFTTVLTRVVPVPIKPTSLKVKALLKEAGTGKLKEDLDHLENHEYYFNDNSQGNDQHAGEDKKNATDASNEPAINENKNTEKDVTVTKDGIKHLDLYV